METTEPVLGRSVPATIFRMVDLPAPLAPTRATCSRSASWKVMPPKMVSLPKVLPRSLTVRMGVAGIEAPKGHGRRRSSRRRRGRYGRRATTGGRSPKARREKRRRRPSPQPPATGVSPAARIDDFPGGRQQVSGNTSRPSFDLGPGAAGAAAQAGDRARERGSRSQYTSALGPHGLVRLAAQSVDLGIVLPSSSPRPLLVGWIALAF